MPQTHEQVHEHAKIRTATNRSFGLTVGGIVLLIGLYRVAFSDAGLVGLTLILLLLGSVLDSVGMAKTRMAGTRQSALDQTRLLVLATIVNPDRPVRRFCAHRCAHWPVDARLWQAAAGIGTLDRASAILLDRARTTCRVAQNI